MTGQKIKTSFSGVIFLLLTAIIWGSSFLSQSVGSSYVEPFTFNGIRTVLGALTLLPVIIIKDCFKHRFSKQKNDKKVKPFDKKIVIYGSIIGVCLCLASNFQQIAFTDPNHSAGKIAFITAMYMFLVPVIGLFINKKVPALTWFCVIIGFTGLYFLCIDSKGFGGVTKGDVFAFICAIFYSFQILLIERFAPGVDGVKLSCIQFSVSGIITCILMFIFENPQWASIKAAAVPILYSGIGSCTIAYTLQILGQQRCESTIASIIMCMESVFAVLTEAAFTAWFGFGSKNLTVREICGCVIMFAAIILSEVVQYLDSKKTQKTQLKNNQCDIIKE